MASGKPGAVQIPTQRKQLGERREEYNDLLRRLAADANGRGNSGSPLAVLLSAIRQQAMRLPGIDNDNDFLEWLEETAPADVSDVAGQASEAVNARLADSLDELDGMILSAIEEAHAISGIETTAAGTEGMLTALWQNTFTRVSAAHEAWMERAFIKRGQGVVETVYPDADERKRLYDYGYSPHVGRRFESAAATLREILGQSDNYSDMTEELRLALFVRLGEIVADDGGYGFSVRDTEMGRNLYANWPQVLAWWMMVSGAAAPPPKDLRAWQIFVSDNLEFRLGIAVGAVVARAWSEGSEGPLDTPTLETWKEVTELPWFAFWAKELLRWGTLEPFVAFTLSVGIAKSRPEAASMQASFFEWLAEDMEGAATSADRIDPRRFLKWSRSVQPERARTPRRRPIPAQLSGTDGRKERYAVIPVRSPNRIRWLDASGYRLAVSDIPEDFPASTLQNSDYDLVVRDGTATVIKTF